MRFIVPFPPGGVSDIIGRLMGRWLSDRLGQLVIEDRGGVGSNLGTEIVVNAPADGYALLLDGSANAVNASLYPDLSFNYLRDISPAASMFRAPHIMEVNPSFPAKTVPEFIAYAKAHPGQINMTSAGTGTKMPGVLRRYPHNPRLGNRLGVAEVVLLSFRVRTHILRRHQPGIVTKRPQLATEMMRPTHASMPIRHGGILANRA